MKQTNINTYKRQRQHDLVATGLRVVEKMENNASFPNPPAALAALKSLLPEYQAALVNAKSGDRELINIKNNKKAAVLSLLAELADYVTLTANGNRELLFSSGFDVPAERSTQPLPVVKKLEVELGPPGKATTRILGAGSARAFMHQYCTETPTPETVWISVGSSYRSYTFTGLNSTSRYWFRVVALYYGGQAVESPVVQKVIQ